MRCPNPDPTDPEADLPPAVVQRLAARAQARLPVPSEIDQAILTQARQHLATLDQPRAYHRSAPFGRRLRAWAREWMPEFGWLASGGARVSVALSALAIVAGLGFWWANDLRAPPALAGDLNKDGQVNILDAFALALATEAGQRPNAGVDLNQDGRVDGADVAILATRAVALEKGGRL